MVPGQLDRRHLCGWTRRGLEWAWLCPQHRRARFQLRTSWEILLDLDWRGLHYGDIEVIGTVYEGFGLQLRV